MSSIAARSFAKPRAGLGDVAARLRSQECTIAYLGASVTAQADGYRPRLHDAICWMTGRNHRSAAAGTGAMGSITGVFLMDDLVLRHQPDLCFVEYATSDVAGTTPPEHLEAAVAGIVGKLDDARCAACFLYLLRTDREPAVMRAVVDTYERVAERHALPSIDVAAELGASSAVSLLRDGVHTTEAGSDLTAAAVLRGLERILAASNDPRLALMGDATFRGATVVAPTTEMFRDPGGCHERRFRLVYRYLEIDSSNELLFVPTGDLVGLLVIVGPDAGWIEVEAGGATGEYLVWDEHSSYDRLGSVILSPFPASGAEVSIRLSDRPVDYSQARRPIDPDRAANKRLKLAGLMVRP